MKLTDREQKLIDILTKQEGWTDLKIERRSKKEFDVGVKGKEKNSFSDEPNNFSACLLLASIRSLTDWCYNSDWFDDPSMVRAGDWSGVRDTDEETLWIYFNQFVVPLVS